jgi:hypothetical protein
MTISTNAPEGVNGGEWLHALYEHFGGAEALTAEEAHPIPISVAAELLLGGDVADAENVAESIVHRALTVDSDHPLAATTAADVEEAVAYLIEHGFLADVVSIECTEPHRHHVGCEEHMLEFRLPGVGG